MASVKLEDFDISPTTGFVPENPLVRLPEYFSPWEQVCDDLPNLWENGTTRSVIEKLPLLDHGLLSSQKEWYRAYVVLIAMTHSYVWCHGIQEAAKILPKCIAVPLIGIARHTGLPPVMTQYYALCNWKRATPDSELELPITMTGTKAEEGFFLNTVEVELAFGRGGAPYFGGSAAQSTIFQALDGYLGVPHRTKTGDEHYLTKMRMHMPPKHRAFIEAIESGPASLKDYVLEKKNNLLTEKYNGCVEAVGKYRDVHLNVVVKYVTIQANRNQKSPSKRFSDTGTGGQALLPFLKTIRNETKEQRINQTTPEDNQQYLSI